MTEFIRYKNFEFDKEIWEKGFMSTSHTFDDVSEIPIGAVDKLATASISIIKDRNDKIVYCLNLEGVHKNGRTYSFAFYETYDDCFRAFLWIQEQKVLHGTTVLLSLSDFTIPLFKK